MLTALSGASVGARPLLSLNADDLRSLSAATDTITGEGVAVKKVTNVFSKKILAKRALREIKLLQHFRGHRNVCPLESLYVAVELGLTSDADHLSIRYGYPTAGELQRNLSV